MVETTNMLEAVSAKASHEEPACVNICKENIEKIESDNQGSGVMDSGATVHLTGCKKHLKNIRKVNIHVKCADNKFIVAELQGDLEIIVNGFKIVLKDVLYVPGAPTLISSGKLVQDGTYMTAEWKLDYYIYLFATQELITKITRVPRDPSKKLYVLEFTYATNELADFEAAKSVFDEAVNIATDHFALPRNGHLTADLVHRRFLHVQPELLGRLNKRFKGELSFCDACAVGGLHCKKYSKKRAKHVTNKSRRKIAVDPSKAVTVTVTKDGDSAPKEISSEEEARYLLSNSTNRNFCKSLAADTKISPVRSARNIKYAHVVICKETRVTMTFLSEKINDFELEFKDWTENFYNLNGRYPGLLHLDQGGEFTSKSLKDYCKKKGIKLKYSCTGASNENALAERKIGVTWTQMLKLLAYSGVPFQLWDYCWDYCVLVGNHIPHSGINYEIPLEKAGIATFLRMIYIFGCEVFFVDPSRMKHEARALRGVFLGIDLEIKGWRILDIESKKVIVSRDVLFNEPVSPFREISKPSLIMLKYGTWPQGIDLEVEGKGASHVSPDLHVSSSNSNQDNFPQEESSTENQSESPVDISSSEPKASNGNNDKIDTKVDASFVPILPPLPSLPLSPIQPDIDIDVTNQTPSQIPPPPTEPPPNLTPALDNTTTDETSKIPNKNSSRMLGNTLGKDKELNFDTPELGKKAKKRFQKLKDAEGRVRRFYKSNDDGRLGFYKDEWLSQKRLQDDRLKDRPPSPKTPVPEAEVDGKPMWEVKEIKKHKILEDGTKKYYVRWKGNFKDQWLNEDDLKGCDDLLTEFWAKKVDKAKDSKSTSKKSTKVAPSSKPVNAPTRRSSRIKALQERENALKTSPDDELPEGKSSFWKARRRFFRRGQKLKNDIVEAVKAKWPKKKSLKECKNNEIYSSLSGVLKEQFQSVARDVDVKLKKATLHEKIENLLNLIKKDDVFLSDTTFAAHEEVEIIDLASTQFPRPEIQPEGVYHVPKDFSEDEIIGLCMDSIMECLDSDLLITKPENQNEARAHKFCDEFREAEHKELSELWDNGTFSIEICPKDRKPIPCRWVYDIKRNKDNEIERFKARLVVQGFRQIEGVDFQKTFSSVAQMRSFRMIVALAIRFGLRITQYDISNAFLNADIDTELYMKPPPGYPLEEDEDGHKNYVFKILKGLYGLKQASRLWKEELVKGFERAGLAVCKCESGVLYVKNSDSLCLVNVHVDDYNICTNDEKLRTRIEGIMSKLFSVKPLGELSLYLGIVIEWSTLPDGRRAAKLHQGPYLDRLLAKMDYSKAKIAKTPSIPSVRLSKVDCPTLEEEKPDWPYRSVTGSLMYAAMGTRLDVTYSTQNCSRYNQNPGKTHVNYQKNILRYIKGTVDRGIWYKEPKDVIDNKVNIIACVDTDWAGCPDTRRSTVGYVVYICGGPVSWKSKLMTTLALSSCEAEFMGLTEVAREVMWMTRFLTEIGIEFNTPKIFCDSQSAIYWAQDPVQHQRNKHVELKYYYIRDLYANQLIEIWKINGLYNPSDPLTKGSDYRMTTNLIPPMMGEEEVKLEE